MVEKGYAKLLLSIIIPVRNEAANVDFVYRELKTLAEYRGWCYEIIFINDHSSDNTWEIVQDIARKNKNVKYIDIVSRGGKDAALMAGLRHACGKFTVVMDGDGQDNPSDIMHLLSFCEKFDCICGYRVLRKNTYVRNIVSLIANIVRDDITGYRMKDAGCALKVMNRQCIRELVKMDPCLFGFSHTFYPALLDAMGYRIIQMPVHNRPRKYGKSKYPVIFGMLITGIRACFRVRKLRKTLQKSNSEYSD